MIKAGIRAKLFIGSLVLIGISIASAELYLAHALEKQLTERVRGDLLIRAGLVAHRVAGTPGGLQSPALNAIAAEQAAIAGVRVTLVRLDGSVAAESGVPPERLGDIEDHAGRPEVVQALAEGQGSSIRYSMTVRRRMMYAAVPIVQRGAPAGTARVALPLTEVDQAIAQIRRTLWTAALLALIVAALVSYSAAELTSRRLRQLTDAARRMAAGDLAGRTRVSGGDEIGSLGNALDQLATSLTRSLDELRGERDLLTGILSSMNEGVLVVGSDGGIVLSNPALREMLLVGPDAVGKSVLQVIRNADLDHVLQAAADGQTSEVEVDLAGLRPRRVLVRAVPLQGAPRGVLGVFVDVTELRRLESVRRDFVANASHELRSPLTTVRAAAETLRTVENDAKASARFIELIQRNADRLANLIDDLLELSRIESRELNLELERLDLGTVVDRILSQHAHRAQLKHITIRHDVGQTAVRADRRALDHVLGNLVDNALKYCPEHAEVRVSASGENGVVRILVADNGPGIPPVHLSRIFERFYRVDAGRSRELGGTGLGLSIVKHLVEAMGGSVSVESTGSGSTFTFTLQRA